MAVIRVALIQFDAILDRWNCEGGCVIYSATGEIVAQANTDGAEEILIHDLML